MKKIFLMASLAAMCACGPKVTVTVENTLDFSRSSELVEIPASQLAALTLGEGQTWVVTRGGEAVPSQLTHDGLLIFPCRLAGGEKATFTVKAGTPTEIPSRVAGGVRAGGNGDVTWENDRVAFRLVGAAQGAEEGSSNGIEPLYKRTEEPVMEKWLAEAASGDLAGREDAGTGLADYTVGHTLGAGAMAPYANFRLFPNTGHTSAEVVDNGPLRVTLRVKYPDLVLTEDYTVSDEREISLDAGMQLTRVVQRLGFGGGMTVAAGFPLHGAVADSVKFNEVGDDAMMLREPATGRSRGVYLGLVFPDGMMNVFRDNSTDVPHALGLGLYDPAKGGYTYYTGYAWERWGEWTGESFSRYLTNFTASRLTPLVVTVR
jgi:hypothetical protein